MISYNDLMAKLDKLGRFNNLDPAVKAGAKKLVKLAHDAGVPILITQGYRSIAEQNALYDQGRTVKYDKNGKKISIVTNAQGGSSYHNFGLAIDFALYYDGKAVSWDRNADFDKDKKKDWDEVVSIAKKLGFAWGGDWKSFKDYPHFEMTFGLTTAQLRAGHKPSAAQQQSAIKKIDGVSATTPTKAVATKPAAEETKNTGDKTIISIQKTYGATPDGIWGPNTLKSILKAFQKQVGVTADGVWGPKTKAASKLIEKGSSGELVRIAQSICYGTGHNPGGIDGIFGSDTTKAVKSFQKAKKLDQDGKVGPKTWAKMF